MATAPKTTTRTTRPAAGFEYEAIGVAYVRFRQRERRIAELRRTDPHSGELRARGELQRDHDAALRELHWWVDPVLDAEEKRDAEHGELRESE